jgi:hypothetical protein
VTAGAVVGSWKLLRIGVEMADTGQRIDLYGAKPVGRMILTGAVTRRISSPPETGAYRRPSPTVPAYSNR